MSKTSSTLQVVSATDLEWLRYLSGAEPSSWRWQQPVARRRLIAVHQTGRAQLALLIDKMLQAPVTVQDNGLIRQIDLLGAIRYTIDRRNSAVSASAIKPDGDWEHLDHTSNDRIAVDTCLFRPRWRRRVVDGLRASLRCWLVAQSAIANAPLADHVLEAVIVGAWRSAHVEKTLRRHAGTKAMRLRIRAAIGMDPEIMAIARASRLCVKHHHVTQSWLTFVWRNLDVLLRIRQQTPNLLAPVAEHMYRYGTAPSQDPVREFVKWLISNGVKRAGFMLLARRSARPFRTVVQRWHEGFALDALVLAMLHAQGPAGARPLSPILYRVAYDRFEAGTTPMRLQALLEPLPARFFSVAQAAADRCHSADRLTSFLRNEYCLVMDWWLFRARSHCDTALPAGTWTQWLRLARQDQARDRARIRTASWPCPLMSWRVPEATVIALSTPLALYEEGCALRHCAYDHVDACKLGRVLLFSARLRHQGKAERGTIGLRSDDGKWRLWDIRGTCNRRLGGHWIVLAREFAAACNARPLCTQLPLPLDTTQQDGVASDG